MGRRDVALARPCAAVTQRRELWPHALQLSARSRWVPSTCSPHRPRSWHPQAAEMLLGAPPPSHQPLLQGATLLPAWPQSPPRMLHQHPRVSRMAGPQGPGAGDPRDTAPRIPVPSPAAAVGHSLSGWTSTPVPPQKADCAGVPRPEVAEMHPLNPSGSAGPAAQWVAAAQFRCRGAGDPGDRRGCRGAVGAESRRLCPP